MNTQPMIRLTRAIRATTGRFGPVVLLSSLACAFSSPSTLAQPESGSVAIQVVPPSPQPAPPPEAPKFDLTKDHVLYTIGYAHLDTQWRWDYPTTIDQYIKSTLDENFKRFDDHPAPSGAGYVFNFTGSARYQMMKEYYPDKFERLKKEIAAGRWFVSGSSVDEGDANVPSPESIIRQVLYGNLYFEREFGKTSVDYMLPDCFGFPASMPSIWAHCGLLGFSTQKLSWGSANGIPFKIGRWIGPDGKSVIAALDPGSYSTAVKGRLDTNADWAKRVNTNGERFGINADYHYYGVGDQGGAPKEADVKNYLASIDQPDSLFKVALTSSDQMYKDITPALAAKLPEYTGDLLLTEHSAGTLTSEAYMKRWNRMGENLADSAERASVMAWFLGGGPGQGEYPRAQLEKLWTRLLANQMHDILPGTSIPRAYTFSWNDEIIASSGFANIQSYAIAQIAQGLHTKDGGDGQPLVVFNPLATPRRDLVELTVNYKDVPPKYVTVFGADNRIIPHQELSRTDRTIRLLTLANVPPVSVSVIDVRPGAARGMTGPFVHVDEATRTLENDALRVTINEAGDIASIINKKDNTEVLAAPARLVFTHEKPKHWPAWNMDWADRQQPPIAAVDGPATIRVIEKGSVRACIEVKREARGSVFVQRYRLAAGDAGRALEVECEVDWQSTECALKASFPLTVTNPKARYNWSLGTIERGNNEPTKYEVPSHEWIDLTSADGSRGVSILDDSKYGSDKPSDNELRLTLLYTPGVRKDYLDQHSQDWGRHHFRYAIYPHDGDFRAGATEQVARRFNQPLRAFTTDAHDGSLARTFQLCSSGTTQVDLRAIKLAERTDWIIVRAQEVHGKAATDVRLTFASPVIEACEVDGQERRIADAKFDGTAIITDFTPYSPRAFAVRLKPLATNLTKPRSAPLTLTYDSDVISTDKNRADGRFDADGRTLPAEELPATIKSQGITFVVGPTADGQNNAIACKGQSIAMPNDAGSAGKSLYLLVAAEKDTEADFAFGAAKQRRMIPSWTGFVGQWDNRVWDREFPEVDYKGEGHVTAITPGFIKRTPIAWFATHRHHPEKGNEAYRFSYLFTIRLDRPAGAAALTLPNDPTIKVLAATLADGPEVLTQPAAPLMDDFTNRAPITFRHQYSPQDAAKDSKDAK